MIRLQDFAGLWSMAREIEDLRAGAFSELTGTCRFVAEEGGGLQQHEQGLLHLPGRQTPLQAERRYIWRSTAPHEVARDISVFFDDGRFFHSFDPNTSKPKAAHACAPDAYEVQYDFSDWPVWQADWRVTGPRKDYLSRSVFRPAQGG
ncbi:DUF6314 family protein [uncultured Celeribacter sp.]|uniref:DUF6314 family protein n=1 Tax=uncultured Celeribacter sp. TaxID=1303376 RepID=UPI002AA64587|nr:DUF6314 family protein [uncultured Celeribacter sp.]